MSDGKVGLGEVKFAGIGKFTSRETITQPEGTSQGVWR